jgi:hypothetical protein
VVQVPVSVDESKSSIQTSAGVQSAMITGILLTVMLFAVSWVSLERMQLEIVFIMVLVPFCLTMLDAMAKNHTFGIALIVDGINTTVAICRM